MTNFNPWALREELTVQEACALAVGDDPTSTIPNSNTKELALMVKESLGLLDIRADEIVFPMAETMFPNESKRVGRKPIIKKAVMKMPLYEILKISIVKDEWVEWFAKCNSYPEFLFPTGKPSHDEWDRWYSTRGDSMCILDPPCHKKNAPQDPTPLKQQNYCTQAMQLINDTVHKFWDGVDPLSDQIPSPDMVKTYLTKEILKRGLKEEGQTERLSSSIVLIITPQTNNDNERYFQKGNLHCTQAMQVMSDAALKFWEGTDPLSNQAPSNEEVGMFVSAELLKRGVRKKDKTRRLSSAIASIIRHQKKPNGNRTVTPKKKVPKQ